MKEQDIVKFKEPVTEDEKNALMVVVEIRDKRVLVSDLRFSKWAIVPTSLFQINELEVVSKLNGVSLGN